MKTMTAKYPGTCDDPIVASHREADEACGRKWECACGACNIARREAAAEKQGHIHLRVPMSRKSRYVRAARRLQLGLSEWMTRTCDAAAGETEEKQ